MDGIKGNMKNKTFNWIYVIGFMLILIVPLGLTNRDPEAISEQENRPLTGRPKVVKDGKINTNITTDIESYLDDRIGLRNELISANALMQYHVFDRMEDGSRYRLGPDGEFNIIENSMLADYQHSNLFTDKKLSKLTGSFQTINDYLKEKDIEFYYMQCWDKQTIYPEYFPTTVNQYGDISRTDQLLTSLEENTDVKVIPLKETFLREKEKGIEVYSKYGDPVHWTPRGSIIGYLDVMDAINEGKDNKYKVLSEDDFDITMTDQGMYFFGGVHRSNISENFERKVTSAVFDEGYGASHEVFDGYKTYHFINDAAGNDTKLMIIGNSFIVNYLKEDFAESFGETLMIWNDVNEDFSDWIDTYQPDIVIYEMVERYAAYGNVNKCAKTLRE